MSQQSKNKTLTIRLPVRTYYETEMDYETFVETWMPDRKETESEEDYKRRCEDVWDGLTKTHKSVRRKDTTIFYLDEIDEAEDFHLGANTEVDPLETYGPAEDEWKEMVEMLDRIATKKRQEHEAMVRRENERVINVLKSMGAVEKNA